MAKYIDADAVISWVNELANIPLNQEVNPGSWANAYSELEEILRDFPAADVAPVIRCKDCAKAERRGGYYYCSTWETNIGADVFCSFAERRENEED